MEVSSVISKFCTFVGLLSKPKKMILPLSQNGLLSWMPDKMFLKIAYWGDLDQKLDLKNPMLFSEKLQWLKLNDRKQSYIVMVDKFRVKKVVSERIGKEYIIPMYGSWKKADQINFEALPNSFVLKCNHDSGGIVICRDKEHFDKQATIAKLNMCLKKNAYIFGREWPYKYVKRRIIAEKLLEDPDNRDLIDYKIYCFNGEPKYCQVIKNRSSDETIDFYDLEWNRMPFTGLGVGTGPKRGEYTPKPDNYSKMLEIARDLAQGTIFVRIDLYNIAGKIYFGEFTLFPKSGFGKFYPDEWNKKLGDMIQI